VTEGTAMARPHGMSPRSRGEAMEADGFDPPATCHQRCPEDLHDTDEEFWGNSHQLVLFLIAVKMEQNLQI